GHSPPGVCDGRAPGSLALHALTVQHGLYEAWAGGISAIEGPLTLTHCIVRENRGYVGGGVTATDGATITGTTVRDNLADYIGGGVAIKAGANAASTDVAITVGTGP